MRIIYVITVAFVPFLLGHFLPKNDIAGGLLDFVNVPWGVIYGIGWWIAGMIFGLGSGPDSFIGFFLWPLLVLLGLAYLGVKISRRGNRAMTVYLAILVFTALLNITPERAATEPFSDLPIFWNFFAAAY